MSLARKRKKVFEVKVVEKWATLQTATSSSQKGSSRNGTEHSVTSSAIVTGHAASEMPDAADENTVAGTIKPVKVYTVAPKPAGYPVEGDQPLSNDLETRSAMTAAPQTAKNHKRKLKKRRHKAKLQQHNSTSAVFTYKPPST